MNFGCFFFTLFLCEIKVISIFHDVIDLKKKNLYHREIFENLTESHFRREVYV